MEYRRDKDNYFIKIEKGENLFESLERFAHEEDVHAGHLSGIGALTNVELGCYDLPRKEYDRKVFPGIYELLSMEGNLSLKDGKPLFHIHPVLSGHDFTAFGGHLFAAESAVTVEINFRVFYADVHREFNEEVGLSLLSFCDEQVK